MRTSPFVLRLASVVCFFLIWELTARILATPLLPSASIVVATLIRDTVSGALPYQLGITMARVAASFVLAMVLGSVIGIALGRSPRLDQFFDSWLTALLNLPALVTIVLLYVWFGLNEVSAITAVALNKLPTTAVTLREGARTLDRDLLEMAKIFRLGQFTTLRRVVLPQLYPYFFAAARSGLALIWKIVLVVELLGRSNGVGFEIQLYFQLFDVTHLLAYTIAFMLVMQMLEWLVLQPLERHATAWR